MREMIRVREAAHELRIQVVDARAYVAIVPFGTGDGGEPDGGGPDDDGAGPTVSLPARRLHALLRAAWADDQYGITGSLDPALWPVEDPEDAFRRDEGERFGWRDDWPDDPHGDDGEVVPFPGSEPSWRWSPPPRPRNHGLPWEPEDDAVLRDTWTRRDPTVATGECLRELAEQLGRTVGGVMQRLYRVGCDPARPGELVMVPAAGPVAAAPAPTAGPEPEEVRQDRGA